MTKIMACTCINKMQDKLHGEGKRVFNATAKTDPQEWRCTVCCATKTSGGSSAVKK